MPYCKNCNAEISINAIYCQKCGSPIILEKKMWDVYSLMLLNASKKSSDEIRSQNNNRDTVFYLSRLEQMGLAFKNTEGEYKQVEDRKMDVLLPHLLRKEKIATLRRAFYLALLFTSLFVFIFYITYLPQEPSTTIYFSFFFLLFSLIALTVEAIYRFRLTRFIKKILGARL
jgi:hypothetical protein